MWTNFFDRIFLINLPNRTERKYHSAAQLHKYKIPFEVWDATYDVNGQNGIYLTLMKLFRYCSKLELQNILVFEDDLNIICPEINKVMPAAIDQLPGDYDMLHLGANIPNPHLASWYSENLIRVRRALALHAVAYSLKGMDKILSLPKMLPIDLQIAEFIHPGGDCYVTYPMLVTQRPGYSDIEGRQTTYSCFLEDRYEKLIQHLNQNKQIV